MSITEQQVYREFNLLFTPVHDLIKRVSVEENKPKLDMNFIILLSKQKQTIEDVVSLSNKIKNLTTQTQETERMLRKLECGLSTMERELVSIRDYRLANPLLREILSGLLKGDKSLKCKFSQAKSDWKEMRRTVLALPYLDFDLMKEFIVLDSLFQILYYYFERHTDRMYITVKSRIFSTISSWRAEELLEEDSLSRQLVENFLRDGGMSTVGEKEIWSQDDIDTRHSSNKKMLFKSSIGKTTRSPTIRKVTFESDNRSKFSLSHHQSNEITSKQLKDVNMASIPSKQVQLVVIDLEDGEPQTIMKNHLSMYDETRAVVKAEIFSSLRHYLNDKLARCYAGKIESEIFSQYYTDINSYYNKGIMCSRILGSLVNKNNNMDNIMTTSFDFTQINRLSEELLDGHNHIQSDASIGKRTRGKERGFTAASVSDMQPFRIGKESPSPFDNSDNESMELLEEVTKIKEQEIAKLKILVANVQKENEILKETLRTVSHGMTSLNSCK